MLIPPEATSHLTQTNPTGETNVLIRFGSEAEVACLRRPSVMPERGEQVVVRTHRGVELAEVLSLVLSGQLDDVPEAKWLRKARPEDLFLRKQLDRLSRLAHANCQRFLEQFGIDDVLLEVEPMLDGRTLYFHFLGKPSHQTEELIERLSAVYEEQVLQSKFATLVEKGCGPGCGTESKSSCGTSGGCSACAVSGRCGS